MFIKVKVVPRNLRSVKGSNMCPLQWHSHCLFFSCFVFFRLVNLSWYPSTRSPMIYLKYVLLCYFVGTLKLQHCMMEEMRSSADGHLEYFMKCGSKEVMQTLRTFRDELFRYSKQITSQIRFCSTLWNNAVRKGITVQMYMLIFDIFEMSVNHKTI